ncbi:MAG: TatD family hydrolase [Phocaeicola sp.]
MWFDLHTHQIEQPADTLAIYNQSPSEEAVKQFCSASLHPWHITELSSAKQLAWLESIVTHPNLLAIGEVGLDKLHGADFFFQQRFFREVIQVAEAAQLPLIIHQVKSLNELIALRKKLRPTTPWILHGFRGKKELALTALKQGFFLSFGVHYHPEALKATPKDLLFLESDTATMPMEILYTRAAELYNYPVEELRDTLLNNAYSLFKRL